MNTNSKILSKLGMQNFSIDTLLIVTAAALLLLILFVILTFVQMRKVKKMNQRMDAFMKGKEARSLENEIARIMEENNVLKERTKENEKSISKLTKRFRTAFQKLGVVKYDAFNQMGGQLSYCIALLDENNSGFIINSVHSTEGSYSYTKEIKGGESDISLGTEEKEALDLAMEK